LFQPQPKPAVLQVGLFRTSIDGTKIYAANPALAKLFGYEQEEQVLENFIPRNSFVDPDKREELVAQLQKDGKVEEFEFLGKRLDGTMRNFILNAFIYKDEGYLEGAILDITERKKNDEIIRKLAMTDPLTGLANRNQFNTNLDAAFTYSKRFGQMIALMLIDLDDFKPVNDNYGHPVGDAFLLHVAKELNATFRKIDTTARMGGDEFAVILNGVNSREDAVRLAEKVLVRLATPLKIDQHTVHVGASMGICFFPGDANNVEDMLNNVDKALYQAKTLGKNQICLHVVEQ
jgi:diguanylate cyclase (GGDEF)-like protein/PAS domain S-box-containing protein